VKHGAPTQVKSAPVTLRLRVVMPAVLAKSLSAQRRLSPRLLPFQRLSHGALTQVKFAPRRSVMLWLLLRHGVLTLARSALKLSVTHMLWLLLPMKSWQACKISNLATSLRHFDMYKAFKTPGLIAQNYFQNYTLHVQF
jgi:hypothetical protein